MNWQIDPSHSTVEASAKHMMVTTVRGRSSHITAEIDYDPEAPAKASAVVRIPTATIATGDEKRDAHLRSADFFDSERYPEAVFRLTGLRPKGGRYRADGELTIRGVTRPVTAEADVSAVFDDAWGGKRFAVSARAKIDRREWGLAWNMPVANGVLVSNEVVLDVELQAVAAAVPQTAAA
ncbi:MAG TPA: YceI family protein [Candidatus Limnocylindria bacterium]|nr:YceI family protein [Candidatus Limnocylindria bacterium]